MVCSQLCAITPAELGDSLNRMCEWPSCVPAVKVKNIRRSGQAITVETNKVLAGKALTRQELREWKRQVSYWVAGDSALNVRILSDGHELGDLVVSPIDTFGAVPSLEGKTIALWASHGRYYNETEERWIWQRALQYGAVEDRLTTEYTARLVPMLEAAGARVLQPRPDMRDPEAYLPGPSGLPRWMEGARYWLEYKGYPERIWNATVLNDKYNNKGRSEYRNDLLCRPLWVNYLVEKGEQIDLVLAIHTDGYDEPGDDKMVGTLAIYYDQDDNKSTTLRDGRSRAKVNRQIAYTIQRTLVTEMRQMVDTAWAERQCWCSNYAEARIPVVPTVLLEVLSHKDITDIQHALDPHDLDATAAAIYKGVARSLSPLPQEEKDSAKIRVKYGSNTGELRVNYGFEENSASTGRKAVLVVNAFRKVCGPTFVLDSLHAGMIDAGIPDSVSYALVGMQYEFRRSEPWRSDDDCGWGMSDQRWIGQTIAGNTHDYHRKHVAVLKEHGIEADAVVWNDSMQIDSTYQVVDVILGREDEMPRSLADALARFPGKVLICGANIGTGAIVRERELFGHQIYTEPNPQTLYCQEQRALRPGKRDTVLFRWPISGLPAAVRSGKTVRLGTMLESLENWESLYHELICTLYEQKEKSTPTD